MAIDSEGTVRPLGWMVRGDQPQPIAPQLLDRLKVIDDLSSTVSDVLDGMGIVGVVPASTLRPSLPHGRVIGRAITVRNQARRVSASTSAATRDWKMAELAAIAVAAPGDVLVIQGLADVSNMGGIMATIAKRQGMAGAVVDGAVRDVGHSRSIELPIWSSSISPITGKWRCVTTEINSTVSLAGVTVASGDLVIADETGICFVPADRITEVVERCEAIAVYEAGLEKEISAGLPINELLERLYGINLSSRE